MVLSHIRRGLTNQNDSELVVLKTPHLDKVTFFYHACLDACHMRIVGAFMDGFGRSCPPTFQHIHISALVKSSQRVILNDWHVSWCSKSI